MDASESPPWTPSGVRIIERNGTAASQQERPNPLRKIQWVPLGDEYPGLEVKLWTNPPRALLGPIKSTAQFDAEAGIVAMLKLMVLQHRNADGGPWQHPLRDGPMPQPTEDEFWELVPDEVLQIISKHLESARLKMIASVERIFAGSTASSSAETHPSGTGPNGSAGTTSAATSPNAGTVTPEP